MQGLPLKLEIFQPMTQALYLQTERPQVKMYDPGKDSVKVLLGSGQEGIVDVTQETCSFTQVQGVCLLGMVLFVIDVATGAVILTISLAGT